MLWMFCWRICSGCRAFARSQFIDARLDEKESQPKLTTITQSNQGDEWLYEPLRSAMTTQMSATSPFPQIRVEENAQGWAPTKGLFRQFQSLSHIDRVRIYSVILHSPVWLHHCVYHRGVPCSPQRLAFLCSVCLGQDLITFAFSLLKLFVLRCSDSDHP